MPKGVYDHSKVVPWNKGMLGYRAGSKHTEESKAKMAEHARNRRHTDETKAKLSNHFKGRPIKEETKEKIRRTMRAKFSGLQPDPVAQQVRRIRKTREYIEWKQFILEKFSYTCVLCGETDRNKLSVDHIKPLRLFPELATDKENGRVVCSICHLRLPTHGVYSRVNG